MHGVENSAVFPAETHERECNRIKAKLFLRAAAGFRGMQMEKAFAFKVVKPAR